MLGSLVHPVGIPIAAPTAGTAIPNVTLSLQDNVEAFIELYEHATGVWGWPDLWWVFCLLPLLSGEAQLQLYT